MYLGGRLHWPDFFGGGYMNHCNAMPNEISQPAHCPDVDGVDVDLHKGTTNILHTNNGTQQTCFILTMGELDIEPQLASSNEPSDQPPAVLHRTIEGTKNQNNQPIQKICTRTARGRAERAQTTKRPITEESNKTQREETNTKTTSRCGRSPKILGLAMNQPCKAEKPDGRRRQAVTRTKKPACGRQPHLIGPVQSRVEEQDDPYRPAHRPSKIVPEADLIAAAQIQSALSSIQGGLTRRPPTKPHIPCFFVFVLFFFFCLS